MPPEGKYTWTAKVGEKGQIVIPKEAREVFHIAPGDTVLLLGDLDQGIAIVNNARIMQSASAIFDAKSSPDNQESS